MNTWLSRLQETRAVYTRLRKQYVIDPASQSAAEVDLRVNNPLSQADDVRCHDRAPYNPLVHTPHRAGAPFAGPAASAEPVEALL